MKKISDDKLNKLALFTLIIMVLFMSIISMELIVIVYTEKINTEAISDWTTTKKTSKQYVDDGVEFKKIRVTGEPTYVTNICKKGCKLKTDLIGVEYKYIIKVINGDYILDIVKDTKYLLKDKNLGKTIENTYFLNYLNYVVLGTIVKDDNFEYDLAYVLDNKGLIDKFESLDRDELMFTADGVVYYYDECIGNGTNANKVQALRYPFVVEPEILDKVSINYSWCK